MRVGAQTGGVMAALEDWLFLGPPGSGKDTVLAWCVEMVGFGNAIGITVSDLIEEEMARNAVAEAANRELKNGGVNLDDAFVNGLVKRRVELVPMLMRKGFSGSHRSVPQARFLHELLLHQGHLPIYFDIELPEEVGLARIEERFKRLRRPDDDPKVYKRRYARYLDYIGPVREYIHSRTTFVNKIDGVGTLDEVRARVMPHLHINVPESASA